MQSVNLLLHVYSLCLLLAILISSRRDSLKNLSDVLFRIILYTTMTMIVFDYLSRFDGLDYAIYPYLNQIGNFVIFLGSPVIPILWLLYIDYQIYSSEQRIIKYLKGFSVYILFYAMLVIGTIFYGLLYYFSIDNIYHRGDFFYIPEIFKFIIVIIPFILLFLERRRFEPKVITSYLLFGLIPTFGAVLQSIDFQVSYALTAVTISIVVIYINVQNKRMNMDYLTNLFNRRQLDYYILDKMKIYQKRGQAFGAILIDLDDFKEINDKLGHPVGDDALIKTARIIKESVGKDGFVARFGGDEFYVVVEGENLKSIDFMIDNIEKNIQAFNQVEKTYQIHFSYGKITYDPNKHRTLEQFHKSIDDKMYDMKIGKK